MTVTLVTWLDPVSQATYTVIPGSIHGMNVFHLQYTPSHAELDVGETLPLGLASQATKTDPGSQRKMKS